MIKSSYITRLLYEKGLDTEEVVLHDGEGNSHIIIWQTHLSDKTITDYAVFYGDNKMEIFKTLGEALEFFTKNVLGEEIWV